VLKPTPPHNGDPAHPGHRGFGGKVARYLQREYHPLERLLYPMRRTGQKGSAI